MPIEEDNYVHTSQRPTTRRTNFLATDERDYFYFSFYLLLYLLQFFLKLSGTVGRLFGRSFIQVACGVPLDLAP